MFRHATAAEFLLEQLDRPAPRPPADLHLEARDAAWECKHGRLPGDRTEPCGCWAQEPAPVVALAAPGTTAETTSTKEAA